MHIEFDNPQFTSKSGYMLLGCWSVLQRGKKKQLTVFKLSQIGPLYHIFILITYLLIYCTLKLPQLFVVSTDTPAHTLAVWCYQSRTGPSSQPHNWLGEHPHGLHVNSPKPPWATLWGSLQLSSPSPELTSAVRLHPYHRGHCLYLGMDNTHFLHRAPLWVASSQKTHCSCAWWQLHAVVIQLKKIHRLHHLALNFWLEVSME